MKKQYVLFNNTLNKFHLRSYGAKTENKHDDISVTDTCSYTVI